jgi:hypothetical protein
MTEKSGQRRGQGAGEVLRPILDELKHVCQVKSSV